MTNRIRHGRILLNFTLPWSVKIVECITDSQLHRDLEERIRRDIPTTKKASLWLSGIKTSSPQEMQLPAQRLRSKDFNELFALLEGKLHWEKRAQAQSVRRLDKEGVLKPIIALQGLNRFGPDYTDLDVLWQVTTFASPRSILELGSGYSTMLLGAYIKKKAREGTACKCVSVELSTDYASMMRSALETSKLTSGVEIIVPGVRRTNIYGIETPTFDMRAEDSVDMIYLDSAPPGNRLGGADFILENPQLLRPGTVIVVDGRLNALLALMRSSLKFNWLSNIRIYPDLLDSIDALVTFSTIIQIDD